MSVGRICVRAVDTATMDEPVSVAAERMHRAVGTLVVVIRPRADRDRHRQRYYDPDRSQGSQSDGNPGQRGDDAVSQNGRRRHADRNSASRHAARAGASSACGRPRKQLGGFGDARRHLNVVGRRIYGGWKVTAKRNTRRRGSRIVMIRTQQTHRTALKEITYGHSFSS